MTCVELHRPSTNSSSSGSSGTSRSRHQCTRLMSFCFVESNISGVTSLVASPPPSFTHCTRNLSLQSAGSTGPMQVARKDGVGCHGSACDREAGCAIGNARQCTSSGRAEQHASGRQAAAQLCTQRRWTGFEGGAQVWWGSMRHPIAARRQLEQGELCGSARRLAPACVHTCEAWGILPLRLHDDLHLLAAAGLHDAAAGAHAVLFGAGGLHFEGHALAARVLKGQRAWHILPQLEPVRAGGGRRWCTESGRRERQCGWLCTATGSAKARWEVREGGGRGAANPAPPLQAAC